MIFVEPVDCGWGPVSRRRAFTAYVRRDSGKFIGSAQNLYLRLSKKLSHKQLRIDDLIWADEKVVRDEVDELRSSRRVPCAKTSQECLIEYEDRNKRIYEKAMDDAGVNLRDQIFVVGQNPESRWKAANSGVFPLFTATDKVIWLRQEDRPLTALEKFSAHGYPVTPELASCLGVEACWFHLEEKY